MTAIKVLRLITFAVLAAGPAIAQDVDSDTPLDDTPTPIPAQANPQLPSDVVEDAFDPSQFATGGWNGERERLIDSGISPFGSYVSIYAASVSGGIQARDQFAGQLYAGVDIDLEKRLGLEGASFKASVVNRQGRSIASSVGSVFDPITITGGQTTFLYDFTFEQQINDTFNFKIGRGAATDDFSTSPLYAFSLNNTVNGPIRAILLDGLASSFPFPVTFTRLKADLGEGQTLQLGLYQLSDRMFLDELNGVDFSIRSGDGLSVFFEYEWEGEIRGRASRLYLGTHQAFFNGAADFDGVGNTEHFARYYGHFNSEIVKDVQAFITFAWSDQDQIAPLTIQSSFGLNWTGLIPGRPNDRTVFFATYGDYGDAIGVADGEDRDFEFVYEWGHRFQFTPSFFVQPSLQYLVRPGGTGDIPDATVLGVFLGVTF